MEVFVYTSHKKIIFQIPPSCSLDEALKWTNCDASNCPQFNLNDFRSYGNSYSPNYLTYIYISPRVPLDQSSENSLDIQFEFNGNFNYWHTNTEANFLLFLVFVLVALGLIIPFVLIISAVVLKRLRVQFPEEYDNTDNNVVHNDINNQVVFQDEPNGEELATFSTVN